MSGYKVEEEDETYYIDSEGNENREYWLLYSDKQRKRMRSVHKQFFSVWFAVENQLRMFISFNIPTNDFMLRITRLFMMELRNSKQQLNDITQRKQEAKSYKKRLLKIRNKKIPV